MTRGGLLIARPLNEARNPHFIAFVTSCYQGDDSKGLWNMRTGGYLLVEALIVMGEVV